MSNTDSGNTGKGITGNGDDTNNGSNSHNRRAQLLGSKQASIFKVKQQYRQLTGRVVEQEQKNAAKENMRPAKTTSKAVSFAELVQCACFPLTKKSVMVKKTIESNLALLTQYEWILRKMSIAHSLEQVAASTEIKLLSRTTEQFDLQIKRDKSNSKQAQVLLRLNNVNDAAYPKGVFLHCVAEEKFAVIHFANVLDGQAQIIVEEESATFSLLTSANTKLYLC
mmetsp:Transcript_49145/g.157430  ORF Transcript_49145/g.157430 Transcript_49145/m.157430 type:complete len:224 (+) Transcript_49145:342-1013(+)